MQEEHELDGWGQVIHCRAMAVEARLQAPGNPMMRALADTAGRTADRIKATVLRAEEMQLSQNQFSVVQNAMFSESN